MNSLHIPNTPAIRSYAYGSEIESTVSRYLGTQIDYRSGVAVITVRQISVIFGCDDESSQVGIYNLLHADEAPWELIGAPDGHQVSARLRPQFEEDYDGAVEAFHARFPTAAARSIERQRAYIAGWNQNRPPEAPRGPERDYPAPDDLLPPVRFKSRPERHPGLFMEQTSQD